MAEQLQPPPPPAPPSPQSKQPAANLLGAPHPKATRYKRGLVMGLTFGSIAFAGVALVYGVFGTSPHQAAANTQANDTAPRNQGDPDDFGSFPTGYAAVTAPPHVTAPPPAAPGPLTPVGSQSRGMQGGRSGGKDGSLDDAKELQEQREEAQEAAEKAQESDVFFARTTDPELAAGGAAPSLPSLLSGVGAQANANANGNGNQGGQQANSSGDDDQGQQAQKNSFIANNSQTTSDYTNSPLQAPISRYEVQAGTVIPAALVTGVNSDLPGDLTARVTRPVYDSPTGNYLLIPQGAILYGKYDSLISYGQNRALVVWNRIIFPNGNSINLGGMTGTDESGESGLQDQVNRHLPALAATLAAATLLSFGPALALNLTQPSTGQNSTNIFTSPAQTLGQNVNNLGQEMVSKELNRPNTITIRPGWPLRVLVNKDMILAPYSP